MEDVLTVAGARRLSRWRSPSKGILGAIFYSKALRIIGGGFSLCQNLYLMPT